jgi:hypothetical protein
MINPVRICVSITHGNHFHCKIDFVKLPLVKSEFIYLCLDMHVNLRLEINSRGKNLVTTVEYSHGIFCSSFNSESILKSKYILFGDIQTFQNQFCTPEISFASYISEIKLTLMVYSV